MPRLFGVEGALNPVVIEFTLILLLDEQGIEAQGLVQTLAVG